MKTVLSVLITLTLLAACSPPSEFTATESPSPTETLIVATSTHTAVPTNTSVPPTAIPPTPIPPSPTPVSPLIDVSTASKLSLFSTFGQGELLRDLAFSPDETVLVSAGGNNEDFDIRIWEVGSGQLLQTLDQHTDIVWAVAFSPDGEMLASVSKDGTGKVWNWRTGSLLKSFDFPDQVTSVTFSPDGQTLAIGGVKEWPDAAIWTFSVPSWQPEMELTEYWNIPDIIYSPDGKYIVGGGTSRNSRIWQSSDGVELFTLYHSGQVFSLAMSPDGSSFASGAVGEIWIWDIETGEIIRKLSDLSGWVESVAYSADGSLLIARAQYLHFYETSDFQPLFETPSPVGEGLFTISSSGRLLATARSDGLIDLWRVEP